MTVWILERGDFPPFIRFGQIEIFISRIHNEIRIGGGHMHSCRRAALWRELFEPHAVRRLFKYEMASAPKNRLHECHRTAQIASCYSESVCAAGICAPASSSSATVLRNTAT
jgi:hypothetical protein